MYLLDTNHCSYFLIQKNKEVVEKVERLSKESKLAINSTIYGELIAMAEKSERKEENLRIVKFLITVIKIYEIDKVTAEIYGEFCIQLLKKFGPKDKKRNLKLRDVGIGENDLWIACTAIQHGLIIVSSDSDFLRMSEARTLEVESWYSK